MRVVVVGPLAASVFRFRATMMRSMVAEGHEVLALAPDEDEDIRATLAEWGIRFDTVPMSRTGMNPLADLWTTAALARVVRAWRADVLLGFGAKPVVYGLIAARLAGTGLRAAMITGAGSALSGADGLGQRLASRMLRSLYRVGLQQAHVVFFQNGDDERLFRTLGLVGKRQRVVRINGSGVDLDHYAVRPLPSPPVAFVMVARLIRDKGVVEYVNAARTVGRARPELRFRLLGPLDVNPTAITETQLRSWQEEGAIEYLGSSQDVRPALEAAHVCVLPSYGEGMPRAVLEAMSIGRPILTTDVPGCRETVRPGVNGYLVSARDEAALAEQMMTMADEADRLDEMGAASRAIAEERFDVHKVDRVILEALTLRKAVSTPD